MCNSNMSTEESPLGSNITPLRKGVLDFNGYFTAYGDARRDAIVLLSKLERSNHTVDARAQMTIDKLRHVVDETPKVENAVSNTRELLLKNAQILRRAVAECRTALGLSPMIPSAARLTSRRDDDGA